MRYPVKWFHSDMQGAPTLSGDPGALLSVLRGCLIDGFNLVSLSSLTYDPNTGECTAQTATNHGFAKYQVVSISGADQPEYNGEQRVTYADSTSFRFAPPPTPGRPRPPARSTPRQRLSGIGSLRWMMATGRKRRSDPPTRRAPGFIW